MMKKDFTLLYIGGIIGTALLLLVSVWNHCPRFRWYILHHDEETKDTDGFVAATYKRICELFRLLHDTHRHSFMQGYGCCQSVVAAFADRYGLDETLALRIAAGFSGGVGRCPAVSEAAFYFVFPCFLLKKL
ncbi:C-GCAxxG-C-C family protein [Prevotella sp. AGR2160]|uniref:C-GCAxxG-C-C family (seleno)protein n=1 Tax=Prevotella sp. AGR2160 TaxID=1280674 RepID=UPI00048FF0C4